MSRQKTIARRINQLKQFMDEFYPEPRKRRRLPVLDELILTILSQNTSDVNSSAAFDSLRAAFPTWEQVANARARKIAAAIRQGGLADRKAPRIKAILNEIRAERGKYNLGPVCRMSLADGIKYLLHFKGVGMKTASCVMLFSCGKPAFPVDTHILRVSRRLAIVGPKDTADVATQVYMEHSNPADRFKFHIDIIHFGREVCHPRNPECRICKLKRRCAYYRGFRDKGECVKL